MSGGVGGSRRAITVTRPDLQSEENYFSSPDNGTDHFLQKKDVLNRATRSSNDECGKGYSNANARSQLPYQLLTFKKRKK